jgi:UDP-N-acetylmuramate dehydrogenase
VSLQPVTHRLDGVVKIGSFFGNPVVDKEVFDRLQAEYGDIPHRRMEKGRIKLSAAWMIEKAGLKDFHDEETGMATWHLQPLVFVNENAQNTAQLIKFRQKILDAIKDKFGVTLQQEPELLP